MGSSPRTSLLRLSAPIEDLYRRRSQRSKFKDSHKPFFNLSGVGKISSKCKSPLLKFILLAIVTGTIVALAYSPEIYNHNRPSNLASRWIWGGGTDTRYVSNSEVNWDDMSKITKRLNLTKERPGIGILNFNSSEIDEFRRVVRVESKVTLLKLDHVGRDVTWESLYPEWIDEEEEEAVPICPKLPGLKPMARIGLVVVKLPCRRRGEKGKNWSRDVARLHLQLAAAGLAAGGAHPARVVFVTECFPIPNLFTCRELVAREGHVWLYEPNLDVLRQKVNLPVGSCELSLRLPTKEGATYSDNNNHNKTRQAYVTILHSANAYVCGAIAVAQSIRMSGSTRDLVILVDDTISSYHRSGLEAAGWKIRTIERIRNPKAEKDSYNEWNYSKFRLWQLADDYDKIIFVDADLLVLRNIDFLFSAPEISATGNDGTLFNSGVMVVEPSECTFDLLLSHVEEFDSYNGGDQGYLNEIFTHWHRVPKRVNFLKNFWSGDDDLTKAKKSSLFAADPPELHVIHYLGLKPWLCFRDYDCNWNVEILREFASDAAHRRWWRLHDGMAPELQEFCLLKTKQKAQLEFDRRQAEAGRFADGHWRRVPVRDRRIRRCVDGICDWRDMLKHWGETNWTDADFSAPTPPAIRSAAVPFEIVKEN